MQESTCRWNARACALSRRTGRSFGSTRSPRPDAKSLAETMDEVRPFAAQWRCDHAGEIRTGLILSDPIRAAALRRPRTEARTGERMTQKGLTIRRPLHKRR